MQSQPEKLPHEMTDEELVADQISREEAAAKLFGAIRITGQLDDNLDDEPTDESGDLLEHVSAYEYHSPREIADAELNLDD